MKPEGEARSLQKSAIVYYSEPVDIFKETLLNTHFDIILPPSPLSTRWYHFRFSYQNLVFFPRV
jgi:hypothetical protein